MIGFISFIEFVGADGENTVVPLPDPTTENFTGNQMLPGFTGSVSTTKNAARIYSRAQLTLWSGFISGTEAKLTTTSDFGDFDGAVQVAIDGGAFLAAPRSGQIFTLFTGLTHAKRFVELRYAQGLGDAPYLLATGNALAVVGQPPALQTLSSKIQPGANSTTGRYSGMTTANSATFTPALVVPKGQTYGSAINSVRIKGAFTKLVVTLNGTRRIGVSKNGGPSAFYSISDESGTPTRALVIPCDGSTSTYNVWDDGNVLDSGGAFCVAGDSTFLDVGAVRELVQFGDSITFGSGPGATSVDTETMRVASAMGFVGSTIGISGQTITGGKAMITATLAKKPAAGNGDVAILALGGNSASDGIDATEQSDYNNCIDQLLAKGYGKVLCRGILPRAGAEALINAANAILKGLVDARANPNVLWVETSTWTDYTTIDGTHPDALGYVYLSGKATPAYSALLGL